MKQSVQMLCYAFLLALPCVALGAAASQAEQHSSHMGKLMANGERTFHFERTSRGLRGGVQVSKAPQPHSVVSLQASDATSSQVSKVKRHSHSWLQRLFRTNRRAAQKQTQKQKVGICRGSKLRWWIIIKKKCNKAFGKNSKWDKDRQEGKCGEAFNECNTGFYAVCCTQPLGPKNMDAYCDQQNLTFVQAKDNKTFNKDKACQVQQHMRGVKDIMAGIKDTIGMMDQDVITGTASFAPGPSPMAMPVPAPAPAVAPPGLMPVAPAPAPLAFGPPLPAPLETRCAMLTELTRQASERIKAIKSWAEHGGFEKQEPQQHHSNNKGAEKGKHDKDKSFLQEDDHEEAASAEAADPDLFFTVKGVLQVGKKLDHLLKDASFCNRGPDEDDDDDDEDDAQEDLAKDPTQEEEEDEEEEQITTINETSIMDLLNWEGDMKNAVAKFEKDVHPHGFKWWRYRYEYTIVESTVLAFSVMVLYLTMWLLSGVSFFATAKFYKTGLTNRLDRYAWGYFVFHAASLMVMVTVAYMLYIPWGKDNIFNMFAEACHDIVDGRFHVPFLGYSWLYMILDVQFQLFACFALYALFIVMVVSTFKKTLEDWKALSDEREDSSIQPHNHHLYFNVMDAIMKRRVTNTPEYRQIFHDLKLSLSGVQGLDQVLPGWNEFKLHIYMTDGLGKAVEYLVEVSLTTNIFLAASSLVVAVLAHYYQVAFMYFLPVFVVISLLVFVAGLLVSRYFWKLSENDDHNTPAKYVTVHSYCRAIQIMLYCLFFSYSRLLLSNDIFEFYPMVYMSALVSLVVVLVLLWLFAGRVIKETVCALLLPPHLEQAQFKKNLEQVVYWHTTEKCHECGALQFPAHASLSREWAGKTPSGLKAPSGERSPDSTRLFSWRA